MKPRLSLPRFRALPLKTSRERLGPIVLALGYLFLQNFPLGVAYAAPGLFFQAGAGSTRLPLEVSSFDAPGFGDISDAINLATGNLYVGTDALSNNSKLDASDEGKGKFAGNWNFSQKMRLNGYSKTLLGTSGTSAPTGVPVGYRLSSQDYGGTSGARFHSGFLRFNSTPTSSKPGNYRVTFQGRSESVDLPVVYGLSDYFTVGATLTSSWQTFSNTFNVSSAAVAAGQLDRLLELFEYTNNNPAWTVRNLSVEYLGDGGANPATPGNLLAEQNPASSYYAGYFGKPSVTPEQIQGYRLASQDYSASLGHSGFWKGFDADQTAAKGSYRVSFEVRTDAPTLQAIYGLSDYYNAGAVNAIPSWQTFWKEFNTGTATPDRLFELFETTPNNAPWYVRNLNVQYLGDGVTQVFSAPNLIRVQDPGSAAWNGYLVKPTVSPEPANTAPIDMGLINAGFEIPATPNYQYGPSGAALGWTFGGNAGVQRSGWGAAPAPEGQQTAFIQGAGPGSFITATGLLAAASYRLRLKVARRTGQIQPLQVYVDGIPVGYPIVAPSDSFTDIVSLTFPAPAGLHTVKFQGTDGVGDKSVLLDAISLELIPDPVATPTVPPTMTLGLGDGTTMSFDKVDSSTLSNADNDTGVPDWIYQYQGRANTYLYRLKAKAGRSYAGDWIVLTKSGSDTVAHYYTSGGSRTTFYGDGEFADFSQNLYEQNANSGSDPEGLASSAKTQITYTDATNGLIGSVTDRWGRQTDYTYNAPTATNGANMVSSINYLKQANGSYARAVTFEYAVSQLTAVNYQANTGFDANKYTRRFTFGYDGQGRINSTGRPIGDGKTLTTGYTYDASSRITGVTQKVGSVDYEPAIGYDYSVPAKVTVTQGLKRTIYSYDTLNLTLSSKAEKDSGRANDLITSYTYNPNGGVASVTTPAGAVMSFAYDARGNRTLEKTGWTETSGAKYRQTTSTFDHNNRLKTATPDGSGTVAATKNVTTYTATLNGAMTKSDTTVSSASGTSISTNTVSNLDGLTGLLSSSVKSWAGQAITTTLAYKTLGTITHPVFNTDYPSGPASLNGVAGSSVNLSAQQYGDQLATSTTKSTGADGKDVVIDYTYDAIGNPVLETQIGAFQASSAPGTTFNNSTSSNRVTRRAFDGFGNKTWEQVGNGSTTTSESFTRYFSSGDLELSWGGTAANTTRYVYDAQGRLGTLSKLHSSQARGYDAYGNLSSQSEVGVNQTTATYQYDTLDRVVLKVLPDSSTFSTSYDVSGAVLQTVDTPSNPATPGTEVLTATPSKTVINTLDALGRTLSSTLSGGGISGYTVTTDYDAFDHPIKITNGALSMLPAGDRQATYLDYDGGGNLIRKLEPELGRNGIISGDTRRPLSLYSYNAAGQMTQEAKLLDGSFTPDNRSSAVSTTGRWAITRTILNALGKPLSVTNARGYTSTMSYDASSNLTSQKPQTTAAVSFGYDASGRQTGMQDARGNPFFNDYDKLGNITKKWEVHCTDVACTNRVLKTRYLYSYFEDGLLGATDEPGLVNTGYETTELRVYGTSRALPSRIDRAVGNQTARTTPTYDYAGRITSSSIAGDTGTVEQRFDGHGNVVYSRNQGGFVTTTGYDALDRIISKKEWTRTTPKGKAIDNAAGFVDGGGLESLYTYDSAGNLTRKLERGMVTKYIYSSLGKVTIEKQAIIEASEANAKIVASNQYRLDGSKIRTFNVADNRMDYTYDDSGLLTEESSLNADATKHHTLTYTLNERGQREKRVFQGNLAYYAEQRDNQGQALNTANYTTLWSYDNNGNLLSTWDTPEGTSLLQNAFLNIQYSPTNHEISRNHYIYVRRKTSDTGWLTRWGGANGLLLAATVGSVANLYNDRDGLTQTTVVDAGPEVIGASVVTQGADNPDRHSSLGSNQTVVTSYTYFASGTRATTQVKINGGTAKTSSLIATDVRGRPKLERGTADKYVETLYYDEGTVTKLVENNTRTFTENVQTFTSTLGGLTAIDPPQNVSSQAGSTTYTQQNVYYPRGQIQSSNTSSTTKTDYTYEGSSTVWHRTYLSNSGQSYQYTDTGKIFKQTVGSSTTCTEVNNAGVTRPQCGDSQVSSSTEVTHLYDASDYLYKKSSVGNYLKGSNVEYYLDAFGNRTGIKSDADGYLSFQDFQKRYDAEGRVSEFTRHRYVTNGLYGTESGLSDEVNSFRYDPMGNQVIASEATYIQSYSDAKNHTMARRFNNSIYANNELQVIRQKDGSWSYRSKYFGSFFQGYDDFGSDYNGKAYDQNGENYYTNSDKYKDQTYTLIDGLSDTTDFSGIGTQLFSVKPSSDDKDLKPSEPAASTEIGLNIPNATKPSSAQIPTDGNKEQAAAPSSTPQTPDIGAVIMGANGGTQGGDKDLKPKDDSATQSASSATSSVQPEAATQNTDVTSSLLGGTLDASKVQGTENASSGIPNMPVESAEKPSSAPSTPNVTTPQDAKPDGSSAVNLPQIGFGGLEGAKAPIGFVEKPKTKSDSLVFQILDIGIINTTCNGISCTVKYNLDDVAEAAKFGQAKAMAAYGDYYVVSTGRNRDAEILQVTTLLILARSTSDSDVLKWMKATLNVIDEIQTPSARIAARHLLHIAVTRSSDTKQSILTAFLDSSKLQGGSPRERINIAVMDILSISGKRNTLSKQDYMNQKTLLQEEGSGWTEMGQHLAQNFIDYAVFGVLGGLEKELIGQNGQRTLAEELNASRGMQGRKVYDVKTFESCFGGRNSFAADTPVLTSSGLLPIAALFALDGTGNANALSVTQVLTYNEQTGKNEFKTVNHVFINQDPAITYLTLKNGDGSSEPIITTPEHPFYVQGKTENTPSSTGYGPRPPSSDGVRELGSNWVGAGHLKLGDRIRKFNGSSGTVVSVVNVAETREMYNLSVEGNHDFFVGASSWLVHNASNTEKTIYQLIIGNLPSDPNQLLKQGWQDITDPRMAANTAAREYENLRLGIIVRFDPGVQGASGFEGKNHYHIYNPEYNKALGKGKDMYLDINGRPVNKGSAPSHILTRCP